MQNQLHWKQHCKLIANQTRTELNFISRVKSCYSCFLTLRTKENVGTLQDLLHLQKKQQKNIDNSQRQKCCAISFAHWNSLKLGKILDRGHFLWQKWGMQTLYNPITPVRKCTLCNVVLGTNPFLWLAGHLLLWGTKCVLMLISFPWNISY